MVSVDIKHRVYLLTFWGVGGGGGGLIEGYVWGTLLMKNGVVAPLIAQTP